MAATPEMSVKSQHEVVGAVVKTEEGVVLPKIDAEKVRRVIRFTRMFIPEITAGAFGFDSLESLDVNIFVRSVYRMSW